jgi:hypothetical protein
VSEYSLNRNELKLGTNILGISLTLYIQEVVAGIQESFRKNEDVRASF